MASVQLLHAQRATGSAAHSRPVRANLRVQAIAKPRSVRREPIAGQKVVLGLSSASLLYATPALAEEVQVAPDAVDSAVVTVTEVVKAAGLSVKDALGVLASGFKVLQEGYDKAAPVIKQGVDYVAPTLQEAFKEATEAAAPVVQQAAPVVQETLTSAFKSSGVDVQAVSETTDVVTKTARDGLSVVSPYINKAVNFVTTTEPVLLAEYGLAALAFLYLGPPLLGAVFGSLKGYAGELTAATALDEVSNNGNAVLVDIRSTKEKESSGLADVPSSASGKVIEVEYAYTEDRKLRGQLRDPSYIEAQVTALQIASLKRIGKGSKIILLDRNGSNSRTIARELSKRGFGKVFVVAGGFDGNGGWVKSKLLVKPAVFDYSSNSAGFFRTISTRTGTGGRKALPAPR